MGRSKNVLAWLLVIAMMVQVVGFNAPVRGASLTASASQYRFSILEIQPDRNFVLTPSANYELKQISMREFIAIREDLVGKYDIIYFGAKSDVPYKIWGEVASRIPSLTTNPVKDLNYNEFYLGQYTYDYYSGIDITNLKANAVKDFIDKGHMVVFDKMIFTNSNQANSNIYSKFVSYVNAGKTNTKFITTAASCKTTIMGYISNFNTFKADATIRPYMKLVSGPADFITSGVKESTGIKTFTFDALSYTNGEATFDVKLYFDLNGDLAFKAENDELLQYYNGAKGGQSLKLNVAIPEGYTGLQQWKLEIMDKTTGAKNFVIGNTAFKGSQKIKVNVLQIFPPGNTLDMTTNLKNASGVSYLNSDDYDIVIKTMTIADFNKLYTDNPSFTLSNYLVPGTTQKYNLLIFGFNDNYGFADLANTTQAADIQKFINSGQSVMFTHDLFTYRAKDPDTQWGVDFTKAFREVGGQNVFKNTAIPAKPLGYGSPAVCYGFSDGWLYRIRPEYTYLANSWPKYENDFITNKIRKVNDGLLTSYPYALGTTVAVAPTHVQYYKLDMELENLVVWYALDKMDGKPSQVNDPYNPQSYYYTYSVGNITYSGTGHSSLSANVSYAERQMFVNTIVKAVRGSNFAPTVTIEGQRDGQNISKAADNLKFYILAKDPDIQDNRLNARVYLDKNGNGIYESNEIVQTYEGDTALENGVNKQVTINLKNAGVSVFSGDPAETGIKVEVFDGPTIGSGANGFTQLRLKRVNSPNIANDLLINGSAWLVGDKLQVTGNLTINVPATSTQTTVTNINYSLMYLKDLVGNPRKQLDVPNTDISVTNHSSWTADSITDTYKGKNISDINNTKNFNGWPKNLSMQVLFNTAGTYYISSNLQYLVGAGYNLNETKDSEVSIDVKKGQLGMVFRDDTGASVDPAIEVTLTRVKDITGASISPEEIFKGTITGGQLIFGDDATEILKSGTYMIEAESSTGAYDDTKVENILVKNGVDPVTNVNYSMQTIDVIMNNNPIIGVTFSHPDAQINSENRAYNQNNTQTFNAILKFTTTKEMKSAEMEITSLIEWPVSSGKLDVKFDNIIIKPAGSDVACSVTYRGGKYWFEIKKTDLGRFLPGDYTVGLIVDFPDVFGHNAKGKIGIQNGANIVLVNNASYTKPVSSSDFLRFGLDSQAPTITATPIKLNPSTKAMTMKIVAKGTGSEIVEARWVRDNKTLEQAKAGDLLVGVRSLETFTATCDFPSDITEITLYTKDEAGNEAIQVVKIELPDLL